MVELVLILDSFFIRRSYRGNSAMRSKIIAAEVKTGLNGAIKRIFNLITWTLIVRLPLIKYPLSVSMLSGKVITVL
jgi:hypothetical protein